MPLAQLTNLPYSSPVGLLCWKSRLPNSHSHWWTSLVLFKLRFHAFVERKERFPPVWRITFYFLCLQSSNSPCKSLFLWGGKGKAWQGNPLQERKGELGWQDAQQHWMLLQVLIRLHMITEAPLFCDRIALIGLIAALCQRAKLALLTSWVHALSAPGLSGASARSPCSATPQISTHASGCRGAIPWNTNCTAAQERYPNRSLISQIITSWNKSCSLAFFSPHKKWSSLSHNK